MVRILSFQQVTVSDADNVGTGDRKAISPQNLCHSSPSSLPEQVEVENSDETE